MIGLTLKALDQLRDERHLATIGKNGNEEIRISAREIDGRQLVTIRVWARSGDALVPTKAGFNVSAEAFRDLIAGAEMALRTIGASS